ncbi:MAG: protein kinase domain-containing protein [Vicinamibacterales bacterium]
MSLAPGTRIGPYDITGTLGAGGMGEVYRARDTRLKREVALKILPESFAADPDRLARFQREAEVLASLNHPNIAAIYGVEEGPASASGPASTSAAATADKEAGPYVRALVLELVEGETLGDRIARGAIPADEALPIAHQVAEALEAAHDRDVIHRDLKPANIKVTPGGRVKVLDFGLAKMLETARPADSLSMSPTLSIHPTYAGVILGTVGYMSPEQARGKPVDRRTDIWAFGCVLYEMLTGRQAFDTRDTVSDAVAAILTRAPDWSALPDEVPLYLRRLLRRCLQKDPARRLHHIADARVELEDGSSEPGVAAPAVPQRPAAAARWLRALPWTVAALALAVAAWMLWSRPGRPAATGQSVLRLEVNLPAGVELYTASPRPVAVSPDGARIAFVGVRGGSRQAYVRRLDQFEAVPVRGTDGVTSLFFSPDGQSIGSLTAAGLLRTVSLADGLVTTVTDGATFLYGAAWTGDDRIVFVRGGALWQVPRSGNTAEPLTTLGGAQGDTLHAWPIVLPDSGTILFSARASNQWRIDALTFASGERRTVVERGTQPMYAASGHLMFFRDGELLAAPFDAASLGLTGPVVRTTIESVPISVQGTPIVDVSPSGTMVYAPTGALSRLVLVSRQGAEQPLNETLRPYGNPRLAPDGSRVLVEGGDLWIQDVARATFTRIASREDVLLGFPIWMPDGRRVVYRTPGGLRLQDADGGSQSEVVQGTSEFDYPGSMTPDGETLVFLRSSQEGLFDIYAAPLRGGGSVRPVLATAAYEGGARLSPDGRWLMYVSNESGQNEVYLRPFPGPDRRWQISTEGGTQAVWNPSGREVFYRNGDKMMVVGVSTAPDVTLSAPRLLFEQAYAFGGGITIANYDVTRDGQRFIMVKDESTAGRLNVVLNWFTDLSRQ